ncbi:MAG: protein-methionine-sulfoxide reductase catalytic subunit MsrP [Cyanophyceae cyanobacterium]
MVFSHLPPDWQLPEARATDEALFWNRRRLLKTLVGVGIGAAVSPLLQSCQRQDGAIAIAPPVPAAPPPPTNLQAPFLGVERNSAFADPGRSLTEKRLANSYNNFYEFGGTKDIAQRAQRLPTDPWTVEVGGLVKNPRTYDRDDLYKTFPIEERIYRFRCVEAWAMVVPWLGFPMHQLIAAADPLPQAKFVRFTSYYDKDVTTGPGWALGRLPWPYTEGLRLDEMANELAFFALGVYGELLPKQHGAPIRAVLPWKYGFKGAKSIVKVEFLETQPATFWNTLAANEYGFEANVEPEVPHPRWSQATERLIGPGPAVTWQRVPTLPYNGYGDYVAGLYGA